MAEGPPCPEDVGHANGDSVLLQPISLDLLQEEREALVRIIGRVDLDRPVPSRWC